MGSSHWLVPTCVGALPHGAARSTELIAGATGGQTSLLAIRSTQAGISRPVPASRVASVGFTAGTISGTPSPCWRSRSGRRVNADEHG